RDRHCLASQRDGEAKLPAARGERHDQDRVEVLVRPEAQPSLLARVHGLELETDLCGRLEVLLAPADERRRGDVADRRRGSPEAQESRSFPEGAAAASGVPDGKPARGKASGPKAETRGGRGSAGPPA